MTTDDHQHIDLPADGRTISINSDSITSVSVTSDSVEPDDLAVSPDPREPARANIRRLLRGSAVKLRRGAGPWSLVSLLAAAVLTPLAGPSVGLSSQYGELIGGLSGNFLPDTMAWAAARTRGQGGDQEWQEALADALAERLNGSSPRATGLQADVMRLLEAVGALDVISREITESKPELPRLALDSRSTLGVGYPNQGRIRLWNSRTGASRPSPDLSTEMGFFSAMAFAPAVGNDLSYLYVVNGTDAHPLQPRRLLWLPTVTLASADTDSNATTFSIAASADGSLLAMATNTPGTPMYRFPRTWQIPSLNPLGSLAVAPDGDSLVVSDDQGGLLRLGNADERPVHLSGSGTTLHHIAYAPDGSLAAVDDEGNLTLFDPDERGSATLKGDSEIRSDDLVYARGGELLIADAEPRRITSLDATSRILIWDVATRTRINSIKYRPTALALEASPDGDLLAVTESRSSDENSRLLIYRTADLPHSDRPALAVDAGDVGFVRARFSPDAHQVAVATTGAVRLYDTTDGSLLSSVGDHPGAVRDLAFSPDGRTIATATATDSTLRLWNLADSSLVADLTGHTDQVNRIRFAPDGQTLYSVSLDGRLGRWILDPDAILDRICSDLGPTVGSKLDEC